MAVKKENIDLVHCLCAAGADVTIKNKWGVTAGGYSKSLTMLHILLQKAQERKHSDDTIVKSLRDLSVTVEDFKKYISK